MKYFKEIELLNSYYPTYDEYDKFNSNLENIYFFKHAKNFLPSYYQKWLQNYGNKIDLENFNNPGPLFDNINIEFTHSSFKNQTKDAGYFFYIRYGKDVYDNYDYASSLLQPVPVTVTPVHNYYSFKSLGYSQSVNNIQTLGITTGSTFNYKNTNSIQYNYPPNETLYKTAYSGALGLDKNKIAFLRIGLKTEIDDYTEKSTVLSYFDSTLISGQTWNLLDATDEVKNNIYVENKVIVKTGGGRANNKEKLASFGKVSTTVPVHGRAILDLLAYTEGTAGSSNNGYDVMFTFKIVDNWSPDTTQGHPNIPIKSGGLTSTAAGRYQFLYDTWTGLNGKANKSFTKENQDLAGWSLVKQKVSGGETIIKAAYTVAINGVKDVYQNPSFLRMLGKKVSEGQTGYGLGLSYGWASVPDQDGNFIYSGQGGGYTPQDVYDIYLKAVNPSSNNTTASKPTSKSIVIGDSLAFGIDIIYNNIDRIKQPIALDTVGWGINSLLDAINKVTTPYKDVNNLILTIGANDAWNLSSDNKSEKQLITKVKTVFPNAKLYIINGNYGWGGISTREATAATWEDKITKYIKYYQDNGFTVIGKISKVDKHPGKGDTLYTSINPILSTLA